VIVTLVDSTNIAGECRTDVAFHESTGVGHGFGLGIDTSAERWIGDVVPFWAKHINDRAAGTCRETS
jgi:hypothetical protein